ncbi:hypothetical protein ACI8AV_13095 [Geodermatophilus sp. SYSU D00804]
MTGFAPAGTSVTAPDPRKRVNYRLGLVLGEDEFRQDQVHHRERDHQGIRALHGYGTVSGLAVSYDETTGRLHVQPGLAVDPAGRVICVPAEYCASLEAWLQESTAGDGVSGGLPPSFPVHVVLCWTQCETDEVPIPVESCLPAEESRAASRLMDSFELRLTFEPPPLVGEVAPGGPGGDLTDLVEELHGRPDVSGGSVPDATAVVALLREWAVERRPEVAAGRACLPVPAPDPCVLLATVGVDVVEEPGGLRVAAATVDDSTRPVLVSTRLLQEALLARPADTDVEDHGELVGLGDDDHPQYLLADGTRPLSGDLSAAGHRLVDLPPSTAGGQPLVHGQGAGGDLTAAYPEPRLTAVQGVPVDAQTPAERDVLLLHSGAWTARRPWVLPLVSIEDTRREGDEPGYLVWFHLDAPENRVEVAGIDGGVLVHRETATAPFLSEIGPEGTSRPFRNVFSVGVRQEAPLVRFTFALDQILLTDGRTLLAWAERLGIWFVGQAGEGDTSVTAFHRSPGRLG